MNKEQVYREIEAILNLPVGAVTGGEKLSDLRGWDSMAQIAFISAIDDKAKTVVDADTLTRAKTVQDLVSLVAAA